MVDDEQSVWVLRGKRAQVVVASSAGQPCIRYWDEPLADCRAADLVRLWQRPRVPAGVDTDIPIPLTPQLGFGFPGSVSLQVHRNGRAWASAATLVDVTASDRRLSFVSRCAASDIELTNTLELDDSDVMVVSTTLRNTGREPLHVQRLPALCVELDPSLEHVTSFEGRWAFEFQWQTFAALPGAFVRENRAGRTSHYAPPAVLLHGANVDASCGTMLGLHLGWSGNHRVSVESMPDGRRYAALEAVFYPGEIRLEPNAALSAPPVYGAYSAAGLNGLAQCFHRVVRHRLLREPMRQKSRPVHLNTWEALYFDVNANVLPALIDQAAELGIERFVLDDGWFKGRDDDTAGLGDWTVDNAKFPDGLGPIAQRVVDSGMEFGLWLEPEMINPDSDLYRAHPEWAQVVAGIEPLLARHQLVLDLTRDDVRSYLLERIGALLTSLPIAYLKWDMNRDLSQPGGADGTAVAHGHTEALYELLDELRKRHPRVEIESCSSGGARADFGILARTDRIWTSDSNDALDRLRIQRGFQTLFPPEVMGSHVGPFDCHITGRKLDMAFRAGVALFGHMGVEADIRALSDAERKQLAAAINLYKSHRAWLHDGDVVQIATPSYVIAHGIVATDGERALYQYAVVDTPPSLVPNRLRLPGLNDQSRYRVEAIWPASGGATDASNAMLGGDSFAGAALAQVGLPLPVMKPQTLLIFDVQRSTD
ncbi:MAG: alpha-galactosidase [Pseudomonadota bacterium]